MKNIFKIIIILFITALFFLGFKYIKNYNIERLINDKYNAKYYINDLYHSKELNYRLILDEEEKEIYKTYIEKIINFEENFSVDLSNYNFTSDYLFFDKIIKINQAVITDHPEIIYFGYPEFSKNNNSSIVNVKIYYTMNKEDYLNNLTKIKEQIDIINQKTSSLDEYKKVKYVYEYLGNKNNYGNPNDKMAQSAYAAFDDSLSPVCAGYARASQLIFQNIGISSLLISGNLNSSWFIGDAHEWNVVKIDGNYYNFDVTQSSINKANSGKISYYGFLNKNKTSLVANHKKSSPYIDGKKYDYYDYNKLTYNYKKNNLNDLKMTLESTDDKYIELRIKNLDKFKRDFDSIKKELNLKSYSLIDDIIILEKTIK